MAARALWQPCRHTRSARAAMLQRELPGRRAATRAN
uniref:Uncharacterized protein n=1 Tax=Arundo donax TaxID=35708 RepID=A0A0A8XR65_ARUDO